ncbi:MAG TPA: hypothetical protein VL915_03005, partial [Gemmatimonadales bacterium]|nr:hypothetical protein [Gemmatimonadales bacterium]
MARRMLIDASHPEETRVVVVDGTKLSEFDFETASRKPLKGNIYLAKVIRIEPSLQAAFVEYGGNRHGFLAFSEIHPDYFQIPVADRERLIAEQRRQAEADDRREPSDSAEDREERDEEEQEEEVPDSAEAQSAEAPADDEPAADVPQDTVAMAEPVTERAETAPAAEATEAAAAEPAGEPAIEPRTEPASEPVAGAMGESEPRAQAAEIPVETITEARPPEPVETVGGDEV